MIDPKLVAAYQTAKYIVNIDANECRIRVGQPCPLVDKVIANNNAQFAYFITPENPFSITISDEENSLRHARFLDILHNKNYPLYEGYGTDENETWGREKSYLIVCDDEKSMHKLAASFGQNGLLKLRHQKHVELLLIGPLVYQSA